MLWTIFWVIVSFFSIIGLMEFIMCIIESISMRTNRSLSKVSLVVEMSGEDENVEFLLSSLCVMAERIAFKDLMTHVVVCDRGISRTTYDRIQKYIEENPNIYFIEKDEQL